MAANRRNQPKVDLRKEASGFAEKTWRHGLFLGLFLVGVWVISSWMLSDITGEYGANSGYGVVIHMSIVRKAVNMQAGLSFGAGLLEATEPVASAGDKLDWKFQVPQKLLDLGAQQHIVEFQGTVEDGVVKGVLRDGTNVVPIKLPRDNIASIYRMIQSHLPWVS